MNPILEMLINSQQKGHSGNGSIAETLAKQFDLQPKQAESALESLLPAFQKGLGRNASSPKGMAALMEALASGKHDKYLDNPDAAFSSQGQSEGNAILGHLFGKKDVSRAVAARAAEKSGVSQGLLKEMLPAVAPMILGALFKQLGGGAAQGQQAQHAMGGGGILGQILEQMMRNGGSAQPRRQAPGGGNPLEQILEKITKGGFGGGQRGGGTMQTDDRLGDIFNDMLQGGEGTVQSPGEDRGTSLDDILGEIGRNQDEADYRPAEPDAPGEDPYARQPGSLEDLFGDLFKPSPKSTREYDDGIESIFDEFLGPKNS